MTESGDTTEKPTPSGDDAVPDSDQIGSGDDQPGGGSDPEPVEEPSGGGNE